MFIEDTRDIQRKSLGTRGRSRNTSSLVVEDAAEMVSVGKDVRLVRKVCTPGVDKIDAWETWHFSVYLAWRTWSLYIGRTVFLSDGLRSKMFLHGDWVIGASFDPAVISDIDLRLGDSNWRTCCRLPQSYTAHPEHFPRP